MTLLELLKDADKMDKLKDVVATGASIGTVEALIGVRQGRLKQWLEIGSSASKPKNAQEARCRKLYNLYRECAAEARYIAESSQLAKRPAEWLEKNTSSRVVEPQQEALSSPGIGVGGQASSQVVALDVMRQALAALTEAGLPLNPMKTLTAKDVVDVTPND